MMRKNQQNDDVHRWAWANTSVNIEAYPPSHRDSDRIRRMAIRAMLRCRRDVMYQLDYARFVRKEQKYEAFCRVRVQRLIRRRLVMWLKMAALAAAAFFLVRFIGMVLL